MCDQGSRAHRPCCPSQNARITQESSLAFPVGNTILARAAGSARPTARYSLPFVQGEEQNRACIQESNRAALALGKNRVGLPCMWKEEPGPRERACALHHRAGSELQGVGDLRAGLR